MWTTGTLQPEKGLKRLHNLQRQINHQVDRLSAETTENIEHKGVIVEEGIRNDLTEVVNEHTSKVNAMFPVSFQNLFWMQQQKASAFTNACSTWWDTLITGWCLYLRHPSSRVYEMLWESGWVTLHHSAHWETTHYVNSTTGCSTEVDKQLMAAAMAERAEEWESVWYLSGTRSC